MNSIIQSIGLLEGKIRESIPWMLKIIAFISIFLVHTSVTKEDIIESVQQGNQGNLDMDKVQYVEDSLSDSVNEDKMYADNNNKMVQHYDCENPENLEAYGS